MRLNTAEITFKARCDRSTVRLRSEKIPPTNHQAPIMVMRAMVVITGLTRSSIPMIIAQIPQSRTLHQGNDPAQTRA